MPLARMSSVRWSPICLDERMNELIEEYCCASLKQKFQTQRAVDHSPRPSHLTGLDDSKKKNRVIFPKEKGLLKLLEI